jgi:hypothetical protein
MQTHHKSFRNKLTIKAASVSETLVPCELHSMQISFMMFLITLSAWALEDIAGKINNLTLTRHKILGIT